MFACFSNLLNINVSNSAKWVIIKYCCCISISLNLMCNICGAWPERINPPSQTSRNIMLHNAHYNAWTGLPHLDTALCPWSPALSAECQMTTHPTWWWISHIGQPQGRSTLSGIWHLKAIVLHQFKYSSSRCLMWIISDTSPRCILNPALALPPVAPR